MLVTATPLHFPLDHTYLFPSFPTFTFRHISLHSCLPAPHTSHSTDNHTPSATPPPSPPQHPFPCHLFPNPRHTSTHHKPTCSTPPPHLTPPPPPTPPHNSSPPPPHPFPCHHLPHLRRTFGKVQQQDKGAKLSESAPLEREKKTG